MTTSMKHFLFWIVATSIALTSFPSNANENSSSRVLDTHDFVQIANRILSHKKLDEFDNGPSFSRIAGQSFSITFNVRKSLYADDCPGYPTWRYIEGTLSVEMSGGHIFVDTWDEVFTKIFPQNESLSTGLLYFTSFVCNKKASSRYQATNAFGATTTVTRQRYTAIAISSQKQPTTDIVYPQADWRDDILGDAARQLSKSLTLRLTGIVGTWPNGESVLCGTEHMKPKLDFPYDTDTRVCVFKAKSLTYEIMDRLTGRTLYKVKGDGAND